MYLCNAVPVADCVPRAAQEIDQLLELAKAAGKFEELAFNQPSLLRHACMYDSFT